MIVKNFLDTSDIESLEIKSSVKVTIIKGSEFKIKVSGDDADKVKIGKSGSCVFIYFKESSGIAYIGDTFLGNTFVSSNVITANPNNNTFIGSGGKDISIVNGEVFINGKKVEEQKNDNTPSKQPVEIEIQCPSNLSITCILSGNAKLISTPEFDKSHITLQGNCSAKLLSKSARFKISDCGEVEYRSLGGNLEAYISGSGEIKATGSFNDIDASISGCGKLITGGHVKGDYDVSVSGTGEVRHQGTTAGHKSKSVSGCGSVRW